MSHERHRRVKEVFLAAVEVTPGEREGFLTEACEGDRELIDEIRSLIALEQEADEQFLVQPPLEALGLGLQAGDADFTAPSDGPGGPLPAPYWERYTIVEQIGSGGMGEVYRAFDPRLKRFVALKFISLNSQKQVSRFLREAKAQAKVQHENVLEVYETGEVDGQHYIAMRYVDGPSLLGIREKTTLEQKVRILRQVARAIHAAHREGLVHRDIKPSNIMVEQTPDGALKPWVMDFGIAAEMEGPGLTATGEMLGTPWYMAPERLEGGAERLDRRTDVYSLGVTMFEFLSGKRPFAAESAVEMLALLGDLEARPLRRVQRDLPADLETIVMKCLEREPQRRYPSARAVADDLGRYLDGEPVEARRSSVAYRLLKKVRRYRALVAVSVAALAALALMGGLSLKLQREGRIRAQLAREFGRRVAEMENVMRIAEISPLHDVRREKELVREAMTTIRERLEKTALLGDGTGHYALGQGFLVLGEYDRAREQLERAWARGFRDSDVAYALAAVLEELYLEELVDTELIADEQLRELRRVEIDREYRRAALRYLRSGASERSQSSELRVALTAFFEGRYDDALREAKKRYGRVPWLHEARKLEGDVLAVMAIEAWRDGDLDGTLEGWSRASAAYRAASNVARSDADAYLEQCRLGWSAMRVELAEGRGDPEASFQSGLRACDAALFADPSRIEVHRLRARLHCALAESAIQRGEDPRASLGSAAEAVERALEIRPDDPLSLVTLGKTWFVRARFERATGGDGQVSLARARQALEMAVGSDSRALERYGSLANLEMIEEERSRGPAAPDGELATVKAQAQDRPAAGGPKPQSMSTM